MNPLLTAIYTRYNAAIIWTGGDIAWEDSPNTLWNSAKTATGGRMYTRYAPQGTAFPYTVLDIVAAEAGGTFDHDFDDVDIQFNLFSQSTSEAEIGNMYSYLRSLFDDCALSISGQTFVFMHYDRTWSLSDAENNIRQYAVQYNILKVR